MRRIFTALGMVLTAVAVTVGSASASPGYQASAPVDIARGGGTYLLDLPELTPFRVHFSFNARSDDASSLTSVATGHFFWNDTVNKDFIKGSVICLVIDGGEAFFVSEIVDSNEPTNIGLFAGVQVFDSGLPGAQGDRFHLEFVSFPFPGMCTLSEDEFAFQVVSGNIGVHDAPD
jgi:hypothetical protein